MIIRRMARVLILLTVVLGGCHLYGPPPGEGEKAEHYYMKARPIIEALDKYYGVHGAYPATLDELRPRFLGEVDWPSNMYESAGASFELWFRYEGPGINTCVYRPSADWQCKGLI